MQHTLPLRQGDPVKILKGGLRSLSATVVGGFPFHTNQKTRKDYLVRVEASEAGSAKKERLHFVVRRSELEPVLV